MIDRHALEAVVDGLRVPWILLVVTDVIITIFFNDVDDRDAIRG